jgi:hypothetical protein
MTPEDDKKLRDIFDAKYRELAFSYSTENCPTWSLYLNSIGCSTCEQTKILDSNEFEIIHSPSPFGGFVIMSKETARKVLVLGLP